LLQKYFIPEVMKGPYNFSSSGVYHSPDQLELKDVKEYIQKLPLEDDP